MPSPKPRTSRASAALALVVLSVLAGCGQTDITKARIEAAVGPHFARAYTAQAKLLGHAGVTVESTHAVVDCDRGGPKVPDRGAGSNWRCRLGFVDETGVHREGKVDVSVSANACYVANGTPAALLGFTKITDVAGRDVINPTAEFEGCFDPRKDPRPLSP